MARRGTRRRVVQARGPQHMYVIAGLPIATTRRAVEWLSERLPDVLVQGVPSSSTDGALYPDGLVDTLVRSVGEFAIRRRTNGPERPATPASITLLYVPAPDQERLLTAFDFSLLSGALITLLSRDEKFRQRRHVPEAVEQALAEATGAAGELKQSLYTVVRRLSYQSDNESLLLPPRNFKVGEGNLVPTFRSFRLGERPWNDRLHELGPTGLTHEDIKRIPEKKTRHAFVDSRGMAFLIAHQAAYDGPPRELESEDSSVAILSVLRTLYRFGGALAPGMHHDAQRSDGSALGGANFQCDRDGKVSTEGGYANVYPNDFVRVGKKQSLEE
jgi:hypothetical protein